MDSNGPGSPRAIANLIITKLTDATIYVQDLIEARAEEEWRRVREENEAISREARRRIMDYGDADESLMGDREADEERRRPHLEEHYRAR